MATDNVNVTETKDKINESRGKGRSENSAIDRVGRQGIPDNKTHDKSYVSVTRNISHDKGDCCTVKEIQCKAKNLQKKLAKKQREEIKNMLRKKWKNSGQQCKKNQMRQKLN